MNPFRIAFAHLRANRLSTFLSVLLMALGVGLVSLLLMLSTQLEEKFKRNLAGIDMVVGAKGSPLQIILSSVYQIDSPTGNISLAEATRVTQNPMVKMAIPLSMGDNYRLFRIVGTTPAYLTHYQAKITTGRLFQKPLEVVIGERVAQKTGLKIGDSFASSHGFDSEGDVHDDVKYTVVGITGFTNSVADNVILTPIESVWKIHEEASTSEGRNMIRAMISDDTTQSLPNQEITAMLLAFRSPMGNVILPRLINETGKLQAASPALEVSRLLDLLGVGIDTLRWLALVIILVAGTSVFVSLYNSLKERRYELALMLSLGATRGKLFSMLLLEGLAIAFMGLIAGLGLARLALWVLSLGAEKTFRFDFSVVRLLPEEGLICLAVLLFGVVAAALPSLGVYRLNLSQTLAEE